MQTPRRAPLETLGSNPYPVTGHEISDMGVERRDVRLNIESSN
jgi:hypothetical protein